jgi:hypothetical protein
MSDQTAETAPAEIPADSSVPDAAPTTDGSIQIAPVSTEQSENGKLVGWVASAYGNAKLSARTEKNLRLLERITGDSLTLVFDVLKILGEVTVRCVKRLHRLITESSPPQSPTDNLLSSFSPPSPQDVACVFLEHADNPPPPSPPLSLAPLVEPDERFSSVDKAIADAQYDEALHEMASLPTEGGELAEWHFKVAHRCFELWKQWDVSMPEPKIEEEDYLSQARKRDEKLRGPLEAGCKHIEKALTLDASYPLARLLGRELHSKLAQSGWDWGPKEEGYRHQKRVIELTDALIDYELLDLAQRCALEGRAFGEFFDLVESLFRQGKVTPDIYFYAAMVYEGAVHQAEITTDDERRWPLSTTDQKRAPEFINAALAHLEYCDRHKLEKGMHWHNIMARVLAFKGRFEDATYHFGKFKDLAAREENGNAKIAMFGNPTVRIIKAHLNKKR